MARRKKTEEAKDVRPPKVEKFVQDLKTVLTPAELQERGDNLAKLMGEIDREESELKDHAKEVKARIATKETLARELAGEVRARYAWRPVDCERHFLYADGVVKEVRTDTGEEVNVRDMRDHERQQDLFDGSGSDEDLDDEFDQGEDAAQ